MDGVIMWMGICFVTKTRGAKTAVKMGPGADGRVLLIRFMSVGAGGEGRREGEEGKMKEENK